MRKNSPSNFDLFDNTSNQKSVNAVKKILKINKKCEEKRAWSPKGNFFLYQNVLANPINNKTFKK
jgi:hypothetical protein